MATDNTKNLNISIENFDGDPLKVSWFLSQIKDLKIINGWKDEAALLYLKSKLTGAARDWYASSPSCIDLEFHEACTKLEAFFKYESLPSSSIVELHNISLLPGETIKNLAHRIETLTVKTYPSVKDIKALSQIQSLHFLNALPLSLREKLILQDTTDFQKLVEEAHKYSMAQQNFQQLESHAVVKSSLPSEVTQTEDMTGFQSPGDSMGVVQQRVCPFCSGDHFMMNCIGFQQSLQANNTDVVAQVSAWQSTNNAFPTRAPGVETLNAVSLPCLYCHRYGHPMSRCYDFQSLGSAVQTNTRDQSSGYYQNRQQYREPGQTYSRGTHSNLRRGNGRFRPPVPFNINRDSYPQRNNVEFSARPSDQSLNSYRGR